MDSQIDFFEWQAASPLLAGLEPPMSFEDLGIALGYDPRAQYQGRSIPERQRITEAHKISQFFAPTAKQITAAANVYQMWWNGLIARDPRIAAQRAHPYQAAQWMGRPISEWPWFPGGAPGAVFSGMTGGGKSVLKERLLSLIPQVVERPANTECGWAKLLQLNWLNVSMPTNSSVGALVREIAAEMDRVLGTDYLSILQKGKNVQMQILQVLLWLSNHRCGLLVIEESQKRNMTEVLGPEFLLLFLKILNFGIPMLVIGNPKALDALKQFSQDGRRFTDGGWTDFYPELSPLTDAWVNDFVPSIWGWYVMPTPDEPLDNPAVYLWMKTGGVPALLARLRRDSQIAALFAGSPCVKLEHIETAWVGDTMRVMHPLILALTTQDEAALDDMPDIPSEWFASVWNEIKKDSVIDAAKKRAAALATKEKKAARRVGKVQPGGLSPKKPTKKAGERAPRAARKT